jgi:hypothetical protein
VEGVVVLLDITALPTVLFNECTVMDLVMTSLSRNHIITTPVEEAEGQPSSRIPTTGSILGQLIEDLVD